METEKVIARGCGVEVGTQEVGKTVRTFSYEMNKIWESNAYHNDYNL